jgi:uncharacterized membrane protein YeaQ/YmgE (transglycosylase-associated protein family)
MREAGPVLIGVPLLLLVAAALAGLLAARRVPHRPADRLLDLMVALCGAAVGSATQLLAAGGRAGLVELLVAGLLGAWLTVGIVHQLRPHGGTRRTARGLR